MRTTSKLIIAIGLVVSASAILPALVGFYQYTYTGHTSISESQAFLSMIVGLATGFVTGMLCANSEGMI